MLEDLITWEPFVISNVVSFIEIKKDSVITVFKLQEERTFEFFYCLFSNTFLKAPS